MLCSTTSRTALASCSDVTAAVIYALVLDHVVNEWHVVDTGLCDVSYNCDISLTAECYCMLIA